jgi:hypothetical protein
MEQKLREELSEVIFIGADLGGVSVKNAKDNINAGEVPDSSDCVTNLIIHNVVNAEDLDEVESNFRYAIEQLNTALNQVLNLADSKISEE